MTKNYNNDRYHEVNKINERMVKARQRSGECHKVFGYHCCCNCLDCQYYQSPTISIEEELEKEVQSSRVIDALSCESDIDAMFYEMDLEKEVQKMDKAIKGSKEIYDLYNQGYSEREIAEIIGKPKTTTRDLIQKMKKFIAGSEIFKDYFDYLDQK